MTPETAKTKWCPDAHGWINNSSVVGVNRDQTGAALPRCLCLADGCMGWVWTDAPSNTQGVCGRVKQV